MRLEYGERARAMNDQLVATRAEEKVFREQFAQLQKYAL